VLSYLVFTTQPLLLAPVSGTSHEENSRSERVALGAAALGDEGWEPQRGASVLPYLVFDW